MEEIMVGQPSEKIKSFHGHRGTCHYCPDGVVKMSRNPVSMLLELSQCRCLLCGQAYHYTDESLSNGEIWELDKKFWKEKSEGSVG